MATCHEIQMYVESAYGFRPKPAWIAEVKELCHIPRIKEAPNRIGKERSKSNPCPKAKIDCIKEALKHFEMI
jgi:hypothetical protein